MDSFPPAHEPHVNGLPHLDDLLAGLDDDVDDEAAEAPDLPEVVEAVTGRARDLHRLADRLSADGGGGEGGEGGEGGARDTTLSAVALLRAHAGAVDELAEHLLAARGEDDHTAGHTEGPAGRAATVHGPATGSPASPAAALRADDPPPDDTAPRGVPRPVG